MLEVLLLAEPIRSKAQGTATCLPPAVEGEDDPLVVAPGEVAPPVELLLVLELELVPPGVVALPVLPAL